MMHVCTRGEPQRRWTSAEAFEAVADSDAHVATPRFFNSVSTCSQNLAPSPPEPAHRPRMSRSP